MAVFLPTYFSPISQYSCLWDLETFVFEVEDNYQKQSYRNRCYIYGPNGKQMLSIPVSFSDRYPRKKTKDARIDYRAAWQKQHLKSLEAGYNSSPFFELVKADIEQVFSKKHKFLLDLNIDSYLFVKEMLSLSGSFEKSEAYFDTYESDFRAFGSTKTDQNFNQNRNINSIEI